MLGYHSQIILNGRQVNDSMGGFVADAAIKAMIEAGKAPRKSTVLVLGITFKENCPDSRNSKVVDIIKRLKEYEIDPVVTNFICANIIESCLQNIHKIIKSFV